MGAGILSVLIILFKKIVIFNQCQAYDNDII